MSGKRKPDISAWRNPREVIKKRLGRTSNSKLERHLTLSSLSLPQLTDVRTSASLNDFLTNRSTSANPFKQKLSPRFKKPHLIDDDVDKENIAPGDWTSDSNALSEFPSSVFVKISESNTDQRQPSSSSSSTNARKVQPIDFSCLDEYCSSTPKLHVVNEVIKTRVTNLPIDYRLATKLRLESSKPLPWVEKFKKSGRFPGSNLDEGIRAFCLLGYGVEKLSPNVISDDYLARFVSSTMYWHFPDFAWQPSFPRFETQQRLFPHRDIRSASLQSLGGFYVESVCTQWVSAFDQLYYSWRKGNRQYFYICCANFTVLFLKRTGDSSIDSNDNSHLSSGDPSNLRIVITPTTIGVRQCLRDEGIEYLMPFRKSSSYQSLSTSCKSAVGLGEPNDTTGVTQSDPPLIVSGEFTNSLENLTGQSVVSEKSTNELFLIGDVGCQENSSGKEAAEIDDPKSPDSHISSAESDNVAWFNDLPMSPEKAVKITRNMSFKSNQSFDSSSLDVDGFLNEDVKKSAVYISNLISIQAFYNLLTSTAFGRSTSGAYAGWPPTLLAPQPFLNSTLKTLDWKNQVIKKSGVNSYIYELENGPIMPHMLSLLFDHLNYCAKLKKEDNLVRAHVNGRSMCAGMNEAAGLSAATNIGGFEFNLGEGYCFEK